LDFINILKALNWFNPIVWYSFYRLHQDCELTCDKKVLSYIQPASYKQDSNTIINKTALFSKSHNTFNSAPLLSNKKNLRRKIIMINSFKSKSFKMPIAGIIIVFILGLVCLVNPKADANTVKKTKSTTSINLKNTKPAAKLINNKDYLSELNFVLPKNWSIDKNQKFEYGIIDEKGKSIGLINSIQYVDGFDLLTQKPNHSGITKDEYIDVPLGKLRLITLDSDNGTAASGITGTHDTYLAGIPVKGKAIYILSFTKNDKKAETKSEFIEILKGLR